ncbi:hypothetical protein N1851_000139 [Merluccius polli]|uniref:Uncharacterized protein n=1 Tax=Merluccius polli TaxID=89951 RepID=A0AA47P9Y4_MERPO|nr:hypothetical protein N1851_000139 [Merluccius polli]
MLREKKINRQGQVRESKGIQRQRKIKLLQREKSKQTKRGKMMKQLQQLTPLQVFGKNIKHDSLVSSGCKNWKKALVIFGKHEMAQTHKDSVVAWKSYQATSKQVNIAQMIASANVSEIVERREYLKRIVAVTSVRETGTPFLWP